MNENNSNTVKHSRADLIALLEWITEYVELTQLPLTEASKWAEISRRVLDDEKQNELV